MFILFYLICLISGYIFYFFKYNFIRYKRVVINSHFISLAFCLIALGLSLISDYSFYGGWIAPFFTTVMISTGLFLFVLYARSSSIWLKLYGGLFFTYPLIILIAALFSRVFLVFGAGLILFVLYKPDNLYSGKGMMIREGFSGMLAASQKIELYEIHFPLVKKIGESNLGSEILSQVKIDSIKVVTVAADTLIIQTEPDHRTFKFSKH